MIIKAFLKRSRPPTAKAIILRHSTKNTHRISLSSKTDQTLKTSYYKFGKKEEDKIK